MNKKIRAYVRETMKSYKIADKKLETELISACTDRYETLLAEGKDEERAYLAAVSKAESAVKEKIRPKNKYGFSLTVCCFAFLSSVAEIWALKTSSGEWGFCIFEMSVFLSGLIIALLYIAVKHRAYRWFDYAVLAVLIVSRGATLLQLGVCAYRWATPKIGWYANYEFPWKIVIILTNTEGNFVGSSESQKWLNVYCFHLTVSALLTVVFSVAVSVKTIAKGKEKEGAHLAAGSGAESAVKEKIRPKNKYGFSLTFCCFAFFMSVAEICALKTPSGGLRFCGLEMPLCFWGLTIALLYIAIRHRIYRWFDYVVLAVLIVSWGTALLQIGTYAYHWAVEDRYWTAGYEFPWKIKIFTYQRDDPNSAYYLLKETTAYCFHFILSAISAAGFSILAIRENRKQKQKN